MPDAGRCENGTARGTEWALNVQVAAHSSTLGDQGGSISQNAWFATTAGPKSGTATSRAGGLPTDCRQGGGGRQKVTSVTVRQAKQGGKRAETKRLGLQLKPAERRRSSVTPGLGPVYTRPKRGPFSGVFPHIPWASGRRKRDHPSLNFRGKA